MARPQKCRYLSREIKAYFFLPEGRTQTRIIVTELLADELEAIRLCDGEEFEQTAAGKQMGISRPTVQRLLYSGRKKLAQALTAGQPIQIAFPKYVLRR